VKTVADRQKHGDVTGAQAATLGAAVAPLATHLAC
jgi:hypothetical protein